MASMLILVCLSHSYPYCCEPLGQMLSKGLSEYTRPQDRSLVKILVSGQALAQIPIPSYKRVVLKQFYQYKLSLFT